MIGFLAGCILAIVLDPKKKYVWNLEEIVSYFNTSVYHKLPSLPCDPSYSIHCIQSLLADMDFSCQWYILSIAIQHPSLNLFHQEIKKYISKQCDLKLAKPLLTSDFRLPSPSNKIGLIIVIDIGFNSRTSLLEAASYIRGLPCIEKLILLAPNHNIPPEFNDV